MQHLVPGLVESHGVHTGVLHACQVPLHSILTSSISTASLSLVSSTNLLRVHCILLLMYLMRAMNSTSRGMGPWGTPLIGHFHLHIESLTNSVDVAIQLVPYPHKASHPTTKRQKYFVEHCNVPHRSPGGCHQVLFSCLVMQSVQHLWRNSFPLVMLCHLNHCPSCLMLQHSFQYDLSHDLSSY